MGSFLDWLRGPSQGKDRMTEALQSLGSKNDTTRANAVKTVMSAGPEVIPALLAIIDSRQVEREWSETEKMLNRLYHYQGGMIKDLARELNSDEWEKIKRARGKLKSMPLDRRKMIESIAVLEKAWDISRSQKEAAIDILLQFNIPPASKGPFIQALVNAASDATSGITGPAEKALKQYEGLVEPYLLAELKKDDSRVPALLNLLESCGIHKKETCQVLLHFLSDKSLSVRSSSLRILSRNKEAAGDVVAALLNLKTFKEDLKIVQWVLERIGAHAPESLLPGLSHWDKEVRAAFARALGGVGPAASPVLRHLYRLLKDDGENVRLEAAKAISLIKPDPEGIPALMDCLSEGDAVFKYISLSLASLRKPALPFLLDRLKSGSATARRNAIDTLALMGSEASEVLPALEGVLEDKDDKIQVKAITAIGGFGDAAGYLAPKLINLWKETGQNIIIQTLCKLKEPFAIDILLRSYFDSPRDFGLTVTKNSLMEFANGSKLTAKLISRALEASSYVKAHRPGYKYDAGYITLELSDVAIAALCASKTAVTSNILHLVSVKRDISVHMDKGCGDPWDEKVSFENQRNKALAELRSRGNPAYDYHLFMGNPASPGR